MKYIKKTFLLLFFLLAAVIALASCSSRSNFATQSDQWSTYTKEKTIKIGFDATFVPMGFEEKDGAYAGFDIDLATAVFKQYGIKVEWQAIDWDMKETELKNGTIDLIWNGYSMTDERKQMLRFTDPYMINQQVLVTKKSSGINTIAQMSGKTLGVQAGSSGYEAFMGEPDILKNRVKNKKAIQYSTFTQALIDLDAERIDALLIDRVYANYYLEQEGKLANYNIMPAGYEAESFAVGARKSDKTLVNKINRAFRDLYQSGEFQKISDKWFGEDVATDQVKEK
ncbi:amino acid ABC transporter substrate-binding protein [Streptococcus dentapri]|uniref:Amino acid ABC transporter substrate-binding protein n=1 Tax=Streptococcus dentapri TaxID=573564 RepID=A0ABV8D1C3_9STRE